MTSALIPPVATGSSVAEEYRPFAIKASRNRRQENLELPVMLRALGLSHADRVLEVGCGPGVALPVLARVLQPRKLVGLDLDSALLADARQRASTSRIEAEIVPGDIRAIPFPDASFDLVVDFGTCFHIDRADAALREIARVLIPGGHFATETPISQLISHPVRSFGRRLPWGAAPALRRVRHAGLWELRRRID